MNFSGFSPCAVVGGIIEDAKAIFNETKKSIVIKLEINAKFVLRLLSKSKKVYWN